MTRSTTLLTLARRSAALALFTVQVEPRAQSGPVPPCDGSVTTPAYPEPSATPIVTFWRPADVDKDWKLAACTGWTSKFSGLVTTVARFRDTTSSDSMLARIGAISQLKGVRYWSATGSVWKTLITQATAVIGPKNERARADFTLDEVTSPDGVYFQQTDNLAGKRLYRLRVLEHTSIRVVFVIENVDAMKYAFMTIVPPREMQSIHFLDRDGAGGWRYYGIIRVGENASKYATKSPASLMNRAVAYYRHYAGIPTDQDPPPVVR